MKLIPEDISEIFSSGIFLEFDCQDVEDGERSDFEGQVTLTKAGKVIGLRCTYCCYVSILRCLAFHCSLSLSF